MATKRRKGEARRLDEDDVTLFIQAAEQRPRYRPQTHRTIQEILQRQNPWRWWRLRNDAAWARKQLAKHGYDPEEIRWLL